MNLSKIREKNEVLSYVKISVKCGSSDYLDIKEYSRELRGSVYPKLSKKMRKAFFDY